MVAEKDIVGAPLEIDPKSWSSIMDTENSLLELESQHQEEERALAEKYYKLKLAHYKQRGALVKEIPNFWKTALENHPVLGNLLEVNDTEVLKYLTDIVVERPMPGHVKIIFEFSENPYFAAKELVKEFIADFETGASKILNSEVQWLVENFASGLVFLNFFVNHESLDLGEIIADDLYPNAVRFYQGLVQEEGENLGEEEEEEEAQEH